MPMPDRVIDDNKEKQVPGELQNVDTKHELDVAVRRWGAWTDHNIELPGGVFTISEAVVSEKVRRILQIVSDLSTKPISQIRILDLACLEGQYAVEFARHGAQVLAMEGREANFRKAEFAKRMLGLDNLELVLGDVRDLSPKTHGYFDVVLCLGILYHLDAPDVFRFVESIGEVCRSVVVFDTYVSLTPKRRYPYRGRTYSGRDIAEHTPQETRADKQAKLWSSLDNLKSVWITKATLLNLLMECGFTSAYECHVPVEVRKPRDRVTVVGIKGTPVRVMTSPATNDVTQAAYAEGAPQPASHNQRAFADMRRAATNLLPERARASAKRALIAAGIIRGPRAKWLQGPARG